MASIFGLMFLVAMPNYLQRRTQDQASDLAEAFRKQGAAILAYKNEHGSWPGGEMKGKIPPIVEASLGMFDQEPLGGGEWEWTPAGPGSTPCLCLIDCKAGHRVLVRVDEMLDDGDLTKGSLFQKDNRLIMVLK